MVGLDFEIIFTKCIFEGLLPGLEYRIAPPGAPHQSIPIQCQPSHKRLFRQHTREQTPIAPFPHTADTNHSAIIPKTFAANQPTTIRLYPLSNYTFGTKENQPEEDPSVPARLKRLEEHYEQHGMRRTCEGILVCHEHNHPHILMLQIANAFFKLCNWIPPSNMSLPLTMTDQEITCVPRTMRLMGLKRDSMSDWRQ